MNGQARSSEKAGGPRKTRIMSPAGPSGHGSGGFQGGIPALAVSDRRLKNVADRGYLTPGGKWKGKVTCQKPWSSATACKPAVLACMGARDGGPRTTKHLSQPPFSPSPPIGMMRDSRLDSTNESSARSVTKPAIQVIRCGCCIALEYCSHPLAAMR